VSEDRRRFLARAGKAGLALAGAGGLGLGLWSRRPPELSREAAALAGLPDYAAPGTAGRLAVARGEDRARLAAAALEALGGVGEYVRPGQRVLIKVNAAFASPPAVGATTHPELLQAVVRLCREAGAAEVVVTDNPIQDPASAFQLSGLAGAAAASGARLELPRPEGFARLTLPSGRLIRDWPVLAGPLAGVERVIGLAPVKDHHRSGASLAMKNWYGLLGGRRNLFHQDIHGIIAELALMVRPTLVILDGVWSMTANGPTGGSLEDLKPTRTLIAATDQVAADARAAELLGKGPEELPFLGLAQRLGAGSADWRALSPREVGG
jgi:uncharacterized protein (DUF362 family)